jgi:flagellar motility protein MotE (MotC chaperone)
MLKVPAPRLLPSTITAMAALLLLKCGILLEAAANHGAKLDSAMVASANAASSDETKQPAKPAPPARPKPATAAPSAAIAMQAAPQPSGQPSAGPPPVSESEKALLQELRRRRQELDAKAEVIAARESVLVAAEQKLTARVSEMQVLQAKLEGLDSEQRQKVEAGWQGLVKLYEAMKPKDAATIFNDLTMPILLQVMDRMKDAKAAAVMAAMNPDKARDVTAELAQMRTGRDASGATRGRATSGAPVAGLPNQVTGG